MQRFLDPKNDFAFKRVFGTEKNKEILIAFLNAVFEGVHDQIEDVEFLPLHQDPQIAVLRQSIVDVRCTDSKKREFIVEMQCYEDPDFIKRACIYASRAYSYQADKSENGAEKKKNEEKNFSYRDVKPVIFLAILDKCVLFDDEAYLCHNKLLDIKTFECKIEEFSFSFLELKKFNKSFEESKTMLEKWCYFFKHAQNTTEKDLELIKNKYPMVGMAYKALEMYGLTKEELEAYEHYEMSVWAYEAGLRGAEEKGEERGIAIGEERGIKKSKKETATKMLLRGMTIEEISEITGLPETEIQKLQKIS